MSTNDLDQSAAELGMGALAPETDDAGYRKRMERRQQVQKQRVEERNKEKGLVLVFTGQGKETTAGLGWCCAPLAMASGWRLSSSSRGLGASAKHGHCKPSAAGELACPGRRLHLGNPEPSGINSWEQAWQTALNYLRDGSVKLVLLDELNVALKLGYIEADTVIAGLNERPELTHVAVTGRGAPAALVERADLVTEMTLVHHPFREQGVKAQAGIEF